MVSPHLPLYCNRELLCGTGVCTIRNQTINLSNRFVLLHHKSKDTRLLLHRSSLLLHRSKSRENNLLLHNQENNLLLHNLHTNWSWVINVFNIDWSVSVPPCSSFLFIRLVLPDQLILSISSYWFIQWILLISSYRFPSHRAPHQSSEINGKHQTKSIWIHSFVSWLIKQYSTRCALNTNK